MDLETASGRDSPGKVGAEEDRKGSSQHRQSRQVLSLEPVDAKRTTVEARRVPQAF